MNNIKAEKEFRWIKTSTKSERYMCPRCQTYFKDIDLSIYNYCPKCGTKLLPSAEKE